ncbi:Uncharacterised protein [Megamonas hypermegale]|jgi:hypothetical protein|uniref:Uncharacterized protein n=1 Tax=Megamonas hypermegale TaxID=158847 RepID=A0A378NS96_9FIRM|nr:hypothetical protein [Megamonas hypermegale]STY71273.1 Uncharacterised protein [Megamonas hypermegale]DAP07398.1 MAG TPA: hypothetical protein [Bacteriophage sp.]
MEYIETRLIKEIIKLNNSTYKIKYDNNEEKIINQEYYDKHLLGIDNDFDKVINNFIIDIKTEETPYDTTITAYFKNGCIFIANESNDSIERYYSLKEIKNKGSFIQARRDCCMEQIREKAITYIDNLYASAKLGNNYNTK